MVVAPPGPAAVKEYVCGLPSHAKGKDVEPAGAYVPNAPGPSIEIVTDVASAYDHDTLIVVAAVHVTFDGRSSDWICGFGSVGALVVAVVGFGGAAVGGGADCDWACACGFVVAGLVGTTDVGGADAAAALLDVDVVAGFAAA